MPQVAHELGLSRATIYRFLNRTARQNPLPVVWVGARRRVRRQDLAEWLVRETRKREGRLPEERAKVIRESRGAVRVERAARKARKVKKACAKKASAKKTRAKKSTRRACRRSA